MTAWVVVETVSHRVATPTDATARGLLLSLILPLAFLHTGVAHAQQPPVFQPVPTPPPVVQPAPIFQPAPTPIFVDPATTQIVSPAYPAPAPTSFESPPVFQPVPFAPTGAMPLQPGGSRNSMREIFATTLSVAAQMTGTTLVTGLVQAISGGLIGWFNRKLQSAAPGAPAISAPGQNPYQPTPAFPPVQAGVQPGFEAPADPASVPFVVPQFFDAQTGLQAVPDPAFAAPPPTGPDPGELFAGLAYEVHAVVPGGGTTPVNPATHEFRTGDRFYVYYRPTLPGHMEVYNINPAGAQAQIDSVELAGGQLAQLGPYEFAAMKGEDRLRLVMRPCSSPELVLATRDIINVSAIAPPVGAAPAGEFGLAACGPVTRSVDAAPTRDIRKVALEGTTAFALDPVSPRERSSGQLDAREVTIVFRHR